MKMSRREFLSWSAKYTGSAITLSSLKAFASDAQPLVINKTKLSGEAKQTIRLVVDHIFPTTETPGAIEANVDQFVIMMREQWLNHDEIKLFDYGIIELNKLADNAFQKTFNELESNNQLEILSSLENNYSDHPWYAIGSAASHLNDFIDSPPFICQIKELTTHGFFMSEVGSNKVLRPLVMGSLDLDIPLEKNSSSWAFLPIM